MELFMAQAVLDQEQYDAFCREVLLRQSQPWNCGLMGGALTICGANWHMAKEVLLVLLELKYWAPTITFCR